MCLRMPFAGVSEDASTKVDRWYPESEEAAAKEATCDQSGERVLESQEEVQDTTT